MFRTEPACAAALCPRARATRASSSNPIAVALPSAGAFPVEFVLFGLTLAGVALFHHQAGEPLGGFHRNPADRTSGKAFGRLQYEGFAVILQQVDGADVGLHVTADNIDDIVQGLLQVVGVEDDGGDVLDGPQAKGLGLVGHELPVTKWFLPVYPPRAIGATERPAGQLARLWFENRYRPR